jgi:dipeptidyl aminopeptidase/acylaminoacyl peptidase
VAAQKHSITHEDVYTARRLGAPVVSPDGKWMVLQVTEPAYDEKDQNSDLWIATTDGSAMPRRLTSTKGGESGPAWSPDSRRVAFAARREGDETTQIYVIEVGQPGEAQRITTVSSGARTPRWRPDGTAVLFTSDVYPDAKSDEDNKKVAEERRKRKWNARVYDTFPIRDWDRWLDDRRPSLFVQPLETGAKAADILAGSNLVASRGFAGQWGSGGDSIAAAWSPDGSSVVFAATTNRTDAAFAETIQSLWIVPAAGGEPRRLTTDNNSYNDPTFSADGKLLFATMEPANDRIYNLSRLVRFEWPEASTPTVMTAGFDRAVGSFSPAPDGKTIFFLAEDQGRQKLYSLPVSGGTVKEVGTLTNGTYGSFDLGGGAEAPVLVANWESAVNPPETGRVDLASGKWSAWSRFNADRAAAIDWQPLQEFWFTSKRGTRIHSFVALPPNFEASKKYPLLVLLHGGPHSMWIDQFVIRWNYHLLGQPGYVVLLTNYTGSTGFGEKFAQAIQGDPLEGPASEINEAADEAIRRFPYIDASRQAAAGASYGGHLANWLAVTTTRYKALVSHAGLSDQAMQWGTSDTIYGRERAAGGPPWQSSPVWTKQSPLSRAANLKTPMLVSVGERDYRVPMNNAILMFSALQRMKVPSRLIVFPSENHWVLNGENSRFWYGEVHAWLAKWLSVSSTSTAQ